MEVKRNMLKEIKEHSENISTEESNQIILKNLDFIQDGHFAVGKYSTIDSNIGEIPVIEIRSMLANTQNQLIQLNQFREHAAILKDKDLFIIDIRGNGGEIDSYCKDWISTYTGQEINVGGNVNSELWTRTTIKGIEEAIKIHEDESI